MYIQAYSREKNNCKLERIISWKDSKRVIGYTLKLPKISIVLVFRGH